MRARPEKIRLAVALALLLAGCQATLNDVNGDLAAGRGNAELKSGDLDAAIADYTQSLALNPTLPATWSNRGLAKQRKGDIAGAMADYDRAIALNPGFAAAYFNRALARKAKGDRAGALADYNHAVGIDPSMGRPDQLP
jgi:tetratricopeptide (TPR) repeat protein